MSEIGLHILSGHPLLYVLSNEEERFVGMLQRFCMRQKTPLKIYRLSEGLREVSFSGDALWQVARHGKLKEELRDPIAMLEQLKKSTPAEGIFLLLDFHPMLRDALAKRLLKDVGQRFKQCRNTAIILAPVLNLPVDLASDR